MSATLPLLRLTAAGAVLVALAACGSTGNGGGSGGNTATVTAVNYHFNPSTVPVSAGTVTVTFQNNGTVMHSLTLDDGSGEVDVDPGKSATLTITAPQSGSLTFHCKHHPTEMKGSFVVGGGAGAGASSSSSSSTSNGYGY